MLSIGEMAKQLGVSVATLRRWDKVGKLSAATRTRGRHRRYTAPAGVGEDDKRTVIYARVSSHDQKLDLVRQVGRLQTHAEHQKWTDVETITDLGSGMNCRKPGLLRLLCLILSGRCKRLIIENKDRLLRFGVELVLWLCKLRGCAVVIVDDNPLRSPEETLARDVLEVITVFSSRLYGARSASRKRERAVTA